VTNIPEGWVVELETVIELAKRIAASEITHEEAEAILDDLAVPP
jgi:hypothetical protein